MSSPPSTKTMNDIHTSQPQRHLSYNASIPSPSEFSSGSAMAVDSLQGPAMPLKVVVDGPPPFQHDHKGLRTPPFRVPSSVLAASNGQSRYDDDARPQLQPILQPSTQPAQQQHQSLNYHYGPDPPTSRTHDPVTPAPPDGPGRRLQQQSVIRLPSPGHSQPLERRHSEHIPSRPSSNSSDRQPTSLASSRPGPISLAQIRPPTSLVSINMQQQQQQQQRPHRPSIDPNFHPFQGPSTPITPSENTYLSRTMEHLDLFYQNVRSHVEWEVETMQKELTGQITLSQQQGIEVANRLRRERNMLREEMVRSTADAKARNDRVRELEEEMGELRRVVKDKDMEIDRLSRENASLKRMQQEVEDRLAARDLEHLQKVKNANQPLRGVVDDLAFRSNMALGRESASETPTVVNSPLERAKTLIKGDPEDVEMKLPQSPLTPLTAHRENPNSFSNNRHQEHYASSYYREHTFPSPTTSRPLTPLKLRNNCLPIPPPMSGRGSHQLPTPSTNSPPMKYHSYFRPKHATDTRGQLPPINEPDTHQMPTPPSSGSAPAAPPLPGLSPLMLDSGLRNGKAVDDTPGRKRSRSVFERDDIKIGPPHGSRSVSDPVLSGGGREDRHQQPQQQSPLVGRKSGTDVSPKLCKSVEGDISVRRNGGSQASNDRQQFSKPSPRMDAFRSASVTSPLVSRAETKADGPAGEKEVGGRSSPSPYLARQAGRMATPALPPPPPSPTERKSTPFERRSSPKILSWTPPASMSDSGTATLSGSIERKSLQTTNVKMNGVQPPGPPLPPPLPPSGAAPTPAPVPSPASHHPTIVTPPAPPHPPKPMKLGIKHLDNLFDIRGEKYVCKSCSGSSATFPKSASWNDLIEHCQKEHAKVCEDLLKVPPHQLFEARQRKSISVHLGDTRRGR